MKRAFNIYKLANEKSDIYVTVQRLRSFGNFVKIFLMKKLSLKRVRIIFFRSINHQDSTQSHPLINLLFYSGTGTIFCFAAFQEREAKTHRKKVAIHCFRHSFEINLVNFESLFNISLIHQKATKMRILCYSSKEITSLSNTISMSTSL